MSDVASDVMPDGARGLRPSAAHRPDRPECGPRRRHLLKLAALAVAPLLAGAPRPVASAATDAGRTEGDAPVLPTYPTRLPPPFHHVYELRRGFLSGRGDLTFTRSGSSYQARLDGSVAGFHVLDWDSSGHFDAAGFAPDHFVDTRRGRAPRHARFERGVTGRPDRISYTDPATEQPLPPGAQDRLSWMLQLPAIVDARRYANGDTLTVYVSGARGDANVWDFRVLGTDRIPGPGDAQVDAMRLVREPRHDGDTRVEVWLDPARHHLPLRALMASSDRDALELRLLQSDLP